jgi:hypothetical protein
MSEARIIHSVSSCVRREVLNAGKVWSLKYGFDLDEAMELLNMEEKKVVNKKVINKKVVKKKSEKDSLVLPYNGVVIGFCKGLRKNARMYTQCQNQECERVFCVRCEKECATNDDGRPNAGDVYQRESVPLYEYKDRKGVSVTSYAKYMVKQKITRDMVEAVATHRGVEMNELHYNELKRKAGRVLTRSKGSKKAKIEDSWPLANVSFAHNTNQEVDVVVVKAEEIQEEVEEEVDVVVAEEVEEEVEEEARQFESLADLVFSENYATEHDDYLNYEVFEHEEELDDDLDDAL